MAANSLLSRAADGRGCILKLDLTCVAYEKAHLPTRELAEQLQELVLTELSRAGAASECMRAVCVCAVGYFVCQ